MSWSVENFLDGELMKKIIDGDYAALKASVEASNTTIQQSVGTSDLGRAAQDTSDQVVATGGVA